MSSQQVQQQQTRKFQQCRNGCGQLITFDKAFRGKNNGWVPLDEVIDSLGQKTLQPHKCQNKKQQLQLQPPLQPQQQSHYDLSKEIMTIKAQLLAVINRLDYVEKNI